MSLKFRQYGFIYRFALKFYKKLFLLKYRLMSSFTNKTIIHMLHIGKTGGTAIKYALNNNRKPYINSKFIIISHNHSFCLRDIRSKEKCFFFIREPIDRFVSGFYSRKRKGYPKFNNRWNLDEEIAFKNFNTPNALALALTSEDTNIKQKAINAMNGITHVKSSYWDWFGNEKYFKSRISDIIFIGTQKNLGNDFIKLKKILLLPKGLKLPTDNVNSHKNSELVDKNLDLESIENLKKWYAKDLYFIELLKENKL